jgi:hypothetical protein
MLRREAMSASISSQCSGLPPQRRWSYSEDGGRKRHAHFLAPHVDFMVEMFKSRLGKVDVVRYPPPVPGMAGMAGGHSHTEKKRGWANFTG